MINVTEVNDKKQLYINKDLIKILNVRLNVRSCQDWLYKYYKIYKKEYWPLFIARFLGGIVRRFFISWRNNQMINLYLISQKPYNIWNGQWDYSRNIVRDIRSWETYTRIRLNLTMIKFDLDSIFQIFFAGNLTFWTLYLLIINVVYSLSLPWAFLPFQISFFLNEVLNIVNHLEQHFFKGNIPLVKKSHFRNSVWLFIQSLGFNLIIIFSSQFKYLSQNLNYSIYYIVTWWLVLTDILKWYHGIHILIPSQYWNLFKVYLNGLQKLLIWDTFLRWVETCLIINLNLSFINSFGTLIGAFNKRKIEERGLEMEFRIVKNIFYFLYNISDQLLQPIRDDYVKSLAEIKAAGEEVIITKMPNLYKNINLWYFVSMCKLPIFFLLSFFPNVIFKPLMFIDKLTSSKRDFNFKLELLKTPVTFKLMRFLVLEELVYHYTFPLDELVSTWFKPYVQYEIFFTFLMEWFPFIIIYWRSFIECSLLGYSLEYLINWSLFALLYVRKSYITKRMYKELFWSFFVPVHVVMIFFLVFTFNNLNLF